MVQPPEKRLITEAGLAELLDARLAAGANITMQYDEELGIITIAGLTTAETAENVRNTVAAALVAGVGINIVHDGTANTITISATGGGGGGLDLEAIQDAVAAMILEGSGLSAVYDDTAGTYTLVNTVTDTNTTDPEVVRDTMAAALVAGTGIAITQDDLANTLTIELSGGATDTEAVQEIVAAMILEGSGLTAVYNDTAGTYTISMLDTGWINLPYESGYDGGTVGQLKYRVRGGVVYLAGGGRRIAGNWPAGQDGNMTTISLNGIPLEYRPSNSVTGAGRGTAGRVGFWNVTTNGSVQITPERDSGGTDWVSCANASWPVG